MDKRLPRYAFSKRATRVRVHRAFPRGTDCERKFDQAERRAVERPGFGGCQAKRGVSPPDSRVLPRNACRRRRSPSGFSTTAPPHGCLARASFGP